MPGQQSNLNDDYFRSIEEAHSAGEVGPHAQVAKRTGLLNEGAPLHVCAAAISGLVAAIACNPADVLKSRVMAGGGVTTMAALTQIVRHEGVSGFYRGFWPSYARLGPTIFIQMPLAEALRSAFGVRSL